MPSDHSPAATHEREIFDDIRKEIGEDPARFLDRPLFDGAQDTTSPGWMIQKRIEGIDDLLVIRYWFEVEERLQRGPRDKVIQMLENRAQHLKTHGQRPQRLESLDVRHTPEKECYLVRDGERIPFQQVSRGDARSSLSTDATAVADGGVDDGN